MLSQTSRRLGALSASLQSVSGGVLFSRGGQAECSSSSSSRPSLPLAPASLASPQPALPTLATAGFHSFAASALLQPSGPALSSKAQRTASFLLQLHAPSPLAPSTAQGASALGGASQQRFDSTRIKRYTAMNKKKYWKRRKVQSFIRKKILALRLAKKEKKMKNILIMKEQRDVVARKKKDLANAFLAEYAKMNIQGLSAAAPAAQAK